MEILKKFFRNKNVPAILLANVASELVAGFVIVKQPGWLAGVFIGATSKFVQFPISIYPLYSIPVLVLYAFLSLRYAAGRVKNSGQTLILRVVSAKEGIGEPQEAKQKERDAPLGASPQAG